MCEGEYFIIEKEETVDSEGKHITKYKFKNNKTYGSNMSRDEVKTLIEKLTKLLEL